MNSWLSLIISLPTENATLRQRAWRALKTSGAAVLRDGVYLMPDRQACKVTLDGLAADVLNAGGTALVLRVDEPDDANFVGLFDRSIEYATLLAEVNHVQHLVSSGDPHSLAKQIRKLRKSMAVLGEVDFFSGESRRQTEQALRELELAYTRKTSPDEPSPSDGEIAPLRKSDYRGKIWATRKRPWIDRLASAWLILRWIDPKAQIQWLESPHQCPANALGFDFDGATFSHLNHRVTFEVLAAAFELKQASIARLGALVHYLDVGGVQPTEAAGVECVLAGLRAEISDDDELLAAAMSIFDGLLSTFERDLTTEHAAGEESIR